MIINNIFYFNKLEIKKQKNKNLFHPIFVNFDWIFKKSQQIIIFFHRQRRTQFFQSNIRKHFIVMSTANTETSYSDLKIPNVITIEFAATVSWIGFKITSQSEHFTTWLKKNAHIHGRWQISAENISAIINDSQSGKFFIGTKDEEKNKTINVALDNPPLIQKELTEAIQSAADKYLQFVEEEEEEKKRRNMVPRKKNTSADKYLQFTEEEKEMEKLLFVTQGRRYD